MKHTLWTGLALGVGLLAAGGAVADDSHGVWQTEVDDGAFAHVTLGSCATPTSVCGTITTTFRNGGERYQSPNIGRQLVIDMVPQGDGRYEGSVWRPSNDRIYIGRMELNGDRLQLRGCIAGGLLCSSQTWARVQ